MYQLFALSPVGPPPEASCTSALKILTKEYTIGHSTQLHTNYENIRRKLFAYAIGLTSGCGCKLIKNGEKKKIKLIYNPRKRMAEPFETRVTNHCWECNNVRLQIRRFKTNKGTLVTHLQHTNYRPALYSTLVL